MRLGFLYIEWWLKLERRRTEIMKLRSVETPAIAMAIHKFSVFLSGVIFLANTLHDHVVQHAA